MNVLDYAHYYINGVTKYRVRYVEYQPGEWTAPVLLTANRLSQLEDHSIEKIELVLRRLEDMTEEEFVEAVRLINQEEPIEEIKKHYPEFIKHGMSQMSVEIGQFPIVPHLIHLLLTKGFDLFGLIDAGLAIDAKTINS